MMAGFMIAGPNEALIRSGGGQQPKVVVGGRVFVIPIFQKADRLSLEVMTLTVETPKVYTSEGVAVSVDGVTQVKVARGEDAIRTAAQQFLGRRREEVAQVALQTMEGHQRAILGTMTVEEIYQDRDGFGRKVREVASPDMANMGLEIVSFTIRDIQDEHGYLEALGVRRTSEVKRDADIGSAEADRDAGIRSAAADRDKQAARYAADTKIAESERDFNVEKAAYDREVNARRAEAELATQLQEAKTRQQIREEELEVEVVERKKQIEVEQEEITRRERELAATVRRPAEAERFRLETVATGEKAKTVAEAEAESESLTLLGQGEANAIRQRGEAEADAILAQGIAEAEAMQKKAAAWNEYGQAAVIDKLLTSLPEVAAAVAQPLGKTDRIVMIGGADGQSVGPSRLTNDITKVVAQVPEVVEALTGIDILGTLKNLRGVVSTDSRNGGDDETASSGGDAATEDESPEEASD